MAQIFEMTLSLRGIYYSWCDQKLLGMKGRISDEPFLLPLAICIMKEQQKLKKYTEIRKQKNEAKMSKCQSYFIVLSHKWIDV